MYARHPVLRVLIACALAFLLAPLLVVIGVSFNPTSAFRVPIGAVSTR